MHESQQPQSETTEPTDVDHRVGHQSSSFDDPKLLRPVDAKLDYSVVRIDASESQLLAAANGFAERNLSSSPTRFREVLERGGAVFAAVRHTDKGDQVIGTVSAEKLSDNVVEHRSIAAILGAYPQFSDFSMGARDDFVVADEWRGKHVGIKLAEVARDWILKEKGFDLQVGAFKWKGYNPTFFAERGAYGITLTDELYSMQKDATRIDPDEGEVLRFDRDDLYCDDDGCGDVCGCLMCVYVNPLKGEFAQLPNILDEIDGSTPKDELKRFMFRPDAVLAS